MKVTEILPPEQKAAGSIPAEGTTKVGPDQQVAGSGPFFGSGAIPQTAPYEPISPALPEWEAKTRHRQALPGLNADRVADPAYLYTHIREILARSADYATAHTSDCAERNAIELALLRDKLSTFAAGINTLSTAADEFESVLTALTPAVHWDRSAYGGFTGNVYSNEDAAVMAALTLRLREKTPIGTIRVWRGEIEGWPVQVNHYER